MTPDHGFIGPMLETLTGKRRAAQEKRGADTILDNVFIGAVEIAALVIGFRAVKHMTDNDVMGIIGSLVFVTTSVEIVCELSQRFQWIPRETAAAPRAPVFAPPVRVAPLSLPAAPAPSQSASSHIVFNRS